MTAAFGGEGLLSAPYVQAETVTVDASGAGALTAATGSPYPMPGEFPDWERVLVDLLTPITYTCTTLPYTTSDIEARLPLYLVRRMGGGVDVNAVTDRAHVKVVAFAHTRAAGYDLARDAREALLALQGGGMVNGVLVDWAQEISGAIEMSDVDPLNRTVEVDFLLDARRQFV